MNLLLDSHVYLWWLNDDRKLSKEARTLIGSANTVFVSSISFWEFAIKIELGKLEADIHDLIEEIEPEGFIELTLTARHAATVSKLPNYHRDPFDRMLIAQAISEPLHLVTADSTLAKYSELVKLI